MKDAYEIASIPVEEVIQRLKEPMVLRPQDPIFLPQKNDLMVKIFEGCLALKKIMIEIQPQVKSIREFEQLEEKGHRA